MKQAIEPGDARRICDALNAILADLFALYLKTKHFLWHASGASCGAHCTQVEAYGRQILAMTDPLAARVRVIGAQTLKSIGDIARRQHVLDNDAEGVAPHELLAELMDDHRALIADLCDAQRLSIALHDDETAALVEYWIGAAERSASFGRWTGRPAD